MADEKQAVVDAAWAWRHSQVRADGSLPAPGRGVAGDLARAVDAHRRSIDRRVVTRAEGAGPTAWDKVLDPAF